MLEFIRSDLAGLVAYTPHPDGVGSADVAIEQIDHLDTNESAYDLPEDLKQKLAWTYQQIAANRYPDGEHDALKRAIASYVNESASLPPDTFHSQHVSVGNGSDELIRSLLIATCLRGEGSILVAEPTFSMYAILAETLAIPVIRVGRSLDTFEMDLSAAHSAIVESHNPPVRVVFVVHPNSPTGNALTESELTWLNQLPEHILVVIDEAYFEFSQATVVRNLLQRPNWIVLRTFSKAFRLAAHRVGYAIAHPELTTALEKIRLPYNLPSFSQVAAQVALTHREALLQVIPQIQLERERLLQSLRQQPELQVWDSRANFVYLRLRTTENAQVALSQICQQLKQQGTFIRHTSGGLRITVGTPDENQRTLDRLRGLLSSGFFNL